MEVERSSPGSMQPPVGTDTDVESLVRRALGLEEEEIGGFVRALAPRVVERLDDLELEGFITRLREVPVRRDQVTNDRPRGSTERSADDLLEAVLRQSIGAQARLLHLVATRHVAELDDADRERLFADFRGAAHRAAKGGDLPAAHP